MKIPAVENQRLLKIQGTVNFRDLGGYPARDGRQVRWRRLYRSAHLANLPDRGLEQLSALDLSAVVDFRSKPEAERRPNRLPEGVQQLKLPVGDVMESEIARNFRELLKTKRFQEIEPQDYILQAYSQYATAFTPQYRTFIRTVLDSDGSPVMWHCAAGKDRTGFASAILLKLLGVDQEIILNDYLLSNQYGHRFYGELASVLITQGFQVYQKIKPLTRVDARWLNNSFREIDQEWGDFGGYTRNGLGLSAAEVSELQAMLLESL